MEEKLSKVQEIFRNVLENENLQIMPEFSAANCGDWDSVATVQIVLAVEAQFGVRFTTDEVANLKSVADILKKIA